MTEQKVLLPREAGKYIAEHSKFVTINPDGIKKLADEVFIYLKAGKINISAYDDDGLHPTKEEKSVVDWMFVIDLLNFCFWTPAIGNPTKWRVNGESGYLALCAAIRRAINEGIDITNPHYYATIGVNEVSHIFRSDDPKTRIPLLETRVECLREAGKVLLNKYNGTFENCIKEANKSAIALLKIVVDNFPCFRDEAVFEGKRVAFYKRAQILVADLWSRLLGKGLGEFNDIDELTMFADYRVPQVLVFFGAMEYSKEFMEILKQEKILQSGSREEMEIRGCSIHAVELINEEVKKMIQTDEDCNLKNSIMNASLIDYFLWLYRREHDTKLEYIPFHKVLGKFY